LFSRRKPFLKTVKIISDIKTCETTPARAANDIIVIDDTNKNVDADALSSLHSSETPPSVSSCTQVLGTDVTMSEVETSRHCEDVATAHSMIQTRYQLEAIANVERLLSSIENNELKFMNPIDDLPIAREDVPLSGQRRFVSRQMFEFVKKLGLDCSTYDSDCEVWCVEQEDDVETQSVELTFVSNRLRNFLGYDAFTFLEFVYDFVRVIVDFLKIGDRYACQRLLYNYLRCRGLPVLEGELASFLISSLLKHKPKMAVVETNALSDQVDKLGDVMEYVFDSGFSEAVKRLFICAATCGAFSPKVTYDIFRILGPKMQGTLYDIVRIGVKSLAYVIRAAEKYATGKYTLHQVLFAKDPSAIMAADYATLMYQKDYLCVGLYDPNSHLKPKVSWLKEVDVVIQYYEERLKNTAHTKAIYQTMQTRVMTLKAAKAEVLDAANATYRRAPLGIVIEGDPGIGKSSLIDLHASFWCDLCNYKFDPTLIYHRPMSSKFMDGLKQQPFIHYSELGKGTAYVAKQGLDESAVELLSVIDSQPMLANQAEVDKKGKVWINFELVIADTNNPHLNFHHAVNNPAAYMRRFVFVHAEVKPELRLKDSCGIDYQKVEAGRSAGTVAHDMDLWHFTIYVMVAKDTVNSKKVILYQGYDIYKYREVMKKLMRDHIASQDYIEKLRRSGAMFNFPPRPPSGPSPSSGPPSSPPPGGSGGGDDPPKPPGFGLSDNTDREEMEKMEDDFKSLEETHSKLKESSPGNLVDWLLEKTSRKWKQIKFGEHTAVQPDFDSDSEVLEFESMVQHIPFDRSVLCEDYFVQQDGLIGIESKENEVNTHAHENILHLETPSYEYCERHVSRPDAGLDEKSTDVDFENAVMMLSSQQKIMIAVSKKNNLRSVMFTIGSEYLVPERFQMDVAAALKRVAKRKNIKLPRRIFWQNVDNVDALEKKPLEPDWIGFDFGNLDLEILEVHHNEPTLKKKVTVSIVHSVMVFFRACHLSVVSLFCSWASFFEFDSLIKRFISTALWSIIMTWFGLSFLPSVLSVFGWCAFPVTMMSLDAQAETEGKKLPVYRELARDKWREFYEYMEWDPNVTLVERFWMGARYSVVLGSLSVVALGLFRYRDVMDVLGETHAKEEENDKFSEVEVLSGAGPSLERRKMAAGAKNWGVNDADFTKSLCRESPKSLIKLVEDNTRAMRLEFPGTTRGFLDGYVLGIKGDWVIMSKHYFIGMTESVLLTVTPARSKPFDFQSTQHHVNASDLYDVGEDVVALRLRSLAFKDISSHLSPSEQASSTGKYMMAGGQEGVATLVEKKTLLVKHSPTGDYISLTAYLTYPSLKAVKGDCGKGIVYQRDGGSVLFAIHSAGDGTTGYASVIDAKKLRACFGSTSLLETNSVSALPTIVTNVVDTTLVTSQPLPKSPFSYNPYPQIDFKGKLPGAVCMEKKSRLVKTKFAKTLPEIFYIVFGRFPETLYSRPVMKPHLNSNKEWIDPFSLHLSKVDCVKKSLDSEILCKVVNTLVERFVGGLLERGIVSVSPVTLDVAINGAVYDVFFRRVSASKSAGFGFPGPKSSWLVLGEEEMRTALPEVRELLASIAESYQRGEKVGFVFNAALKDEPRSIEKCEKGKTRVFFVSPLSLLLLQRMYLSPFYTFMVQFSDLFCVALGVDMHTQAGEIRERLASFSSRWMEGDYGGYDVSMPFDIGLAASTVVYEVLKRLGYNEYSLNMVRGLLDDSLFPFVNMNNDLYTSPALQPSGKYATAEDNSLRGLILLLYFWFTLPEWNTKDFFEFVRPLLYGDDMGAGVKEEVEEVFNNLTYAKFVKEVYGMEFTSASKSQQLEKFVDVDSFSFLKRTFRWSTSLERYVAPLDFSSIYKTLEWFIPSSVVSVEDQVLGMCDSSLREVFFSVEGDKFDIMREWMISVLTEDYKIDENLVKRRLLSHSEMIAYYSFTETECKQLERSYEDKLLERKRVLLSQLEDVGDMDPLLQLDAINDFARRKVVSQQLAMKGELKQIDDQLKKIDLKNRLKQYNQVFTNSSEMQNLVEIEEKGDDLNEAMSSYDLANRVVADPNNFFSRPVKIATVSIENETNYFNFFSVWELLSKNPAVRAKLRNYAFMRADLEITIDLSASPFHYGRIQVAYVPMPQSNQVAEAWVTGSDFSNIQKWLSQQRICSVMDISSNASLVLKVPYIAYTPMLRLFATNTPLPAASSFPDFERGALTISTLVGPYTVNSSAPSDLSLYVYARFVNVTLATLTGSGMEVETNSSEMKTGPVENMSTSMAGVMSSLERVPIIQPYASVGNHVFKSLGKFASLFGWSVPRIDPSVSSPELVHNIPLFNNCNVIGRSSAQKMSLDPQQNISVDPRFAAVEEDELTLAFINNVVSLLDTFTWTLSSTPLEAIWTMPVSPSCLVPSLPVSGNYKCVPTAMGFAASFFSYWNGSITYIFDFSKSVQHNGKIMFAYEPSCLQADFVLANINTNIPHAVIIDLQSMNRVELTVHWNSHKMWLRVAGQTEAAGLTQDDITSAEFFANGFLYVVPITKLQCTTDSPVVCNVYVKSASLNYNEPTQENFPTARVYTNCGTQFTGEVNSLDLNQSSLSTTWCDSIHFGEKPITLRGIIKRYVETIRHVFTAENVAWREKVYPDIRLSVGDDAVIPDALSCLRMAFLGMNGGIRKRMRYPGHVFSTTDQVRINLTAPSTVPTSTEVGSTGFSSVNGLVAFVPFFQPGIEVEIPSYTTNLFHPSASTDLYTFESSYDPTYDNFWMRFVDVFVDKCDDFHSLIIETAPSEDFTLLYWMGAPFYSLPE